MSDWQDPEGIFPRGRYRTRRDALPHVEAKREWLNEVHGIDHTALIYLSGNKCVYDTIPVSATETGGDEVGVAMADLCRRCRAGRSMLAWTMLTGRKPSGEGRNDNRLLGIRGIYRDEASDDEERVLVLFAYCCSEYNSSSPDLLIFGVTKNWTTILHDIKRQKS